MMKIIKQFLVIGTLLMSFSLCDASNINQHQDKNTIIGSVPKKIRETLPEIQELKPNLYRKKINHGTECIYELFTRDDNLGWNAIIADIEKSTPHYHKRTTEIYTVLNGSLEVFVNQKSYVLNPGDLIVIPLNSIHWARSLTDKPARILCTCIPAWTPDDHHLINSNSHSSPA